MTMPAAETELFTEPNDAMEGPGLRWDRGLETLVADSALQRFWNETMDDFDPDATPDPFIPETPEEAVERLARTPTSREDSQQAPILTDATLDGNEGIGILRLMRDAAGTPFRAHGTWRSYDGALSLSESMAIGSSQRFCGVLHDAASEFGIDVNVTITGHGDYRDAQGRPLRLVRFISPEAVERTDPASWLATPPALRVAEGS